DLPAQADQFREWMAWLTLTKRERREGLGKALHESDPPGIKCPPQFGECRAPSPRSGCAFRDLHHDAHVLLARVGVLVKPVGVDKLQRRIGRVREDRALEGDVVGVLHDRMVIARLARGNRGSNAPSRSFLTDAARLRPTLRRHSLPAR